MLRGMKLSLIPALLFMGAVLAPIPVQPSATLYDNDEVKVSRALEKAQVQGKFHEHKMNRVMIYLQPGHQRFQYQDGRPTAVSTFKAGEVLWSPPTGMHAGTVLDHDFNIIEVEMKTPGTDKPITSDHDPLKVDPAQMKLEFENSQVRVIRATIKPHAAVPLHSWPTNHVVVFLTDQKFEIKDESGKTMISEHKAGDVLWETPAAHSERNLSGDPFEVVIVEVKK
jgi:quercetin dioxygenase-like cupin family protein